MRLWPVVSLIVSGLGLGGCITHPGAVQHVTFASDREYVVATTRSGPVRGVDGAGVRAFLGLPYAAPPVGDLRWRGPQAVEGWTRTRDATRIGSDCVQAIGREAVLGGGGGLVVGSEDCLFLNVYAPGGEAKVARPVIVYLHGGAFTIGAGANYDPSLMAATQGRVMVTVNYRLGALGWLAHPDFVADGEGVGGNFGLLDQQTALRWVRDNIGGMGGDPDNVTLIAESSGAWSACHLMASPGSEGLFDRVILQSGPCLEPSSLNAAEVEATKGPVFAERLGCAGADAVACLRDVPAWRIARAPSVRSGINGPGSWGPVHTDAVVPISPATAFATGAFTKVPVIVGTNADEGRLFATEVRTQERYDAETVWLYGDDGGRALARYPIGDDGPAISIAQSFTDSRFACPSNVLRRVLSAHVPVHGYEFSDREAPFRLPDWVTGLDMGAYHASELTYVFGTSWVFADAGTFTPEQRGLSDRMMMLWADFGQAADFDTRWPQVSEGGGPVKVFEPNEDGGDRMDATFFDRHQCAFWDGSSLGAVVS